MAQTTIRNRIKRIQTHLGVPDGGLIGPTTLTALENTIFEDPQREGAVENYSLTVSRKGLKQLIKHEISSAAYYRKYLSHPIWPGGDSGITIGIGYDLGQNSEKLIRKDWTGKLSEIDLGKFIVVYGLKSGPVCI